MVYNLFHTLRITLSYNALLLVSGAEERRNEPKKTPAPNHRDFAQEMFIHEAFSSTNSPLIRDNDRFSKKFTCLYNKHAALT